VSDRDGRSGAIAFSASNRSPLLAECRTRALVAEALRRHCQGDRRVHRGELETLGADADLPRGGGGGQSRDMADLRSDAPAPREFPAKCVPVAWELAAPRPEPLDISRASIAATAMTGGQRARPDSPLWATAGARRQGRSTPLSAQSQLDIRCPRIHPCPSTNSPIAHFHAHAALYLTPLQGPPEVQGSAPEVQGNVQPSPFREHHVAWLLTSESYRNAAPDPPTSRDPACHPVLGENARACCTPWRY